MNALEGIPYLEVSSFLVHEFLKIGYMHWPGMLDGGEVQPNELDENRTGGFDLFGRVVAPVYHDVRRTSSKMALAASSPRPLNPLRSRYT